MYKIVEYPKVQDFFNENKKTIYKNRLAHYHLIQYFDALNAGTQTIYQAYNVADDYGGNVIAVWGDSAYYLYGAKWSQDIIDGLLTKIEVAKYTKRFSFCGTSQLVADLLNRSSIEYEVYKNRILYECKRVLPLSKSSNGSAYFSSTDDLNFVGQMTYSYGLSEWGEREGRDLNYAQQLAYQSILQQTSCHWEDNNKIVTIASIIDSESHLPIVGSLYTNPEDRGKGYAKCLVHDLTSQIVAAKGQCGIVTDAADAITNQMFLSIGYEETGRYTSAHTMRETI